jgi:hypothetical protein
VEVAMLVDNTLQLFSVYAEFGNTLVGHGC